MSDSFNSPDHLSLGESEAPGPEQSDTSVNAQSTASTSTAAVADLDEQAAVMESFDEGDPIAEESAPFEEESFDAVADSIDAEIASDEQEVTESFDASVEVVDVEILESQEQEQSYEVHQDGTLTYFQYFLDDESETFGPGYGEWRNETNSSPRSFVSATAVGVGVLAATFGAGLLMAEATNRSNLSKNDSFEAETTANEDERNASEASDLAKTSNPESAMPDWSSTQKALAVSQGSAKANPALGKTTPATSSVTSKLAPLAQSWGTAMPLPPVLAPTASIASPSITAASLPTPAASLPTPPAITASQPAPAAVLPPLPTYQVVQPISSPGALSSRTSSLSRNDQEADQLKERLDALREGSIASPIAPNSVPVTSDGSASLLDGPDNRWVSNVPSQVNVPINPDGTTIENVFESPSQASLTDSPYTNPSVASSPNSAPSTLTSAPTPVAAAPQVSPLELAPVIIEPPHQAASLNETVVPPVAGLLPTPTTPAAGQSGNNDAVPQAVAPENETVEATSQASRVIPPQDRAAMEITPGAIALEVIPPSVSAPVLTAPPEAAPTVSRAAAEKPAMIAAPAMEKQQPQRAVAQTALAPTAQSPELAVLPQGLNSLTELTRIQSPRPLALSRDTARAALDNAEQLEQFMVLPLSVREYQRLWRDSGNEGTFAPVHGFVDYGQNVIAVVVPRGEANQAALTPAEDEPGSSKAAVLATGSDLTEVSAKQAAPAVALSQS